MFQELTTGDLYLFTFGDTDLRVSEHIVLRGAHEGGALSIQRSGRGKNKWIKYKLKDERIKKKKQITAFYMFKPLDLVFDSDVAFLIDHVIHSFNRALDRLRSWWRFKGKLLDSCSP